MFNMIIYLLIISCCGLFGLLKSMKYSIRLEQLKDLTESLSILESEMKYRRDPLPETLERISKYKSNSASDFFSLVSEILKENRTCSMIECWCKAVNECYGKTSLKDEDLEVIKDIGLELGKSDISGQSNMFLRVLKRMEVCCAEAGCEKSTKGKMYKSMGITVGVVIVIILI